MYKLLKENKIIAEKLISTPLKNFINKKINTVLLEIKGNKEI